MLYEAQVSAGHHLIVNKCFHSKEGIYWYIKKWFCADLFTGCFRTAKSNRQDIFNDCYR
jgi:hypothetical protein